MMPHTLKRSGPNPAISPYLPVHSSSLCLVDPVLKGEVETRALKGGRGCDGIEGDTAGLRW